MPDLRAPRRRPAPITALLYARWIDPADGVAPVCLAYDPAVPLQVEIRFPHLGDGHTWVFGRDLLRAARTGPAGEGDVTMRPVRAFILIRFHGVRSDDADAVIALGRREVARFLARTADLVPYGQEAMPGLDAELTDLLDGAWD